MGAGWYFLTGVAYFVIGIVLLVEGDFLFGILILAAGPPSLYAARYFAKRGDY